ncbi:hypothetical protein ELZ19_06815 [Brucella abortus]|uniref:hypothetical protein n=1 Tax=Brucella abortus TaxID=235 RepID=UPI0004E8E943|nr:hypothetical protein [Brucella abortus]KFH18409.1 hypothetical protein IB60_17005 [Brucella abortus LMN1]RUQ67361.1 hypothetical protein ELZ23_15650 [Brucella abortus]RUQ78342.1 hypothetical protein ELZ22_17125 [Brucella abortus]RUQ88252.1 hypothetical protein ELZ18_15430 [Brucella abortus]RUQ90282.1 hypothetical protein ELZ20_15430 [Brucella abortus]
MESDELTPAQAERLAMLAEEAGEVVQAACKALRHGFESTHPDGGPTNRSLLARELRDLNAVMGMMLASGDLPLDEVVGDASDVERKLRYTHHQQ